MGNPREKEISVEELMAEIRQNVVDRGSIDHMPPGDGLNPNSKISPSYYWNQIDANLDAAEHHADVGTKTLPMLRLHRSVRWLARGFGRVLLYMAKIISIPQMHFNRSILLVLRILRNGIREMENKFFAKIYAQNLRIDEFEKKHEQSLSERFTAAEKSIKDEFTARDEEIDHLKKKLNKIRTNIVLQERRLSTLLEEVRKRMPDQIDRDQLHSISKESERMIDPLYLFFEDEFRGSRSDIKTSHQIYLPMLKDAHVGSADRPILDIGCGRGEWLELLKEEGMNAKGVDMNRLLVEENRQRGYDVTEADAIEYLRTINDASIGGVTAFHLIEHLPFHTLIHLLDETVRILKPGGIAIFETPNPENVLVGACHFYTDPTHRNPLPIPLMKFLAEHRGLTRVDIMRLHPFPEEFKLAGSELAERFNEYFYGPRDYAIIGYKVLES
jgi:O-antigen chain-terminating methyltransferase